MIVTDRQYQQLLNEQFRSAAPTMWRILNWPHETTMVRGGPRVWTAQQRR